MASESITLIVAPVDLADDDTEALGKAIKSFNECQSEFRAQLVEAKTYSDAEDFEWHDLREWLTSIYSESRVAAVTSRRFTDNWFSHTEGRITAISTADWRQLFSPPGPHCYLLLEFALSAYFHASDFGESEANPHVSPTGCLMDLCAQKQEMMWKLRVGYVCSNHRALFRRHGGTDLQLEAICRAMDVVRWISLGETKESNVKRSGAQTSDPAMLTVAQLVGSLRPSQLWGVLVLTGTIIAGAFSLGQQVNGWSDPKAKPGTSSERWLIIDGMELPTAGRIRIHAAVNGKHFVSYPTKHLWARAQEDMPPERLPLPHSDAYSVCFTAFLREDNTDAILEAECAEPEVVKEAELPILKRTVSLISSRGPDWFETGFARVTFSMVEQ